MDELTRRLGEPESFTVTEVNGLRDLMLLVKDTKNNDYVEANTAAAMRMARQVLRAHPSISIIHQIYHADLVVAQPDGMALVVIVDSGVGFRTEYFWLSPIYQIPNA